MLVVSRSISHITKRTTQLLEKPAAALQFAKDFVAWKLRWRALTYKAVGSVQMKSAWGETLVRCGCRRKWLPEWLPLFNETRCLEDSRFFGRCYFWHVLTYLCKPVAHSIQASWCGSLTGQDIFGVFHVLEAKRRVHLFNSAWYCIELTYSTWHPLGWNFRGNEHLRGWCGSLPDWHALDAPVPNCMDLPKIWRPSLMYIL